MMADMTTEQHGDGPVAITQAGHRYVGHWHGDVAVFSDGQAFRAGIGWLGNEESRRIIPHICQGHAQ